MLNCKTTIFIMGCVLLVHSVPLGSINSVYTMSTFLEKPQCVDSSSILCDSVEKYPYESLTKKLKTLNEIQMELFNNQTMEDEDRMCDSRIDYIKPRVGFIEEDNLPVYIVNIDGQYTQVVRTEKCIGKNSACPNVVNENNYESQCKQSYTYQRLLTFDVFFQIAIRVIKIPSGCCCMTKIDSNFMPRK